MSEESLAALTAGALPDLTLDLGCGRVPLSAIVAAEAPARFCFVADAGPGAGPAGVLNRDRKSGRRR